ncbi:MAG: hypothetical protein H6818_19340 [Phycisphaerales bacterium]|nr:hypothetical protein [Phycisphaerales bacterium]MCB9863622.1 hypothetical protein [Phycisphaerales bacterium]
MSIGACDSCDSVNRLLAAAGTGLIRHSAALSRPGETQKPQEISGEPVGKSELTDEELEQVRKLEQRDNEVRRHEQAHAAAAGPHARGGPTFEYQNGPDGKQYAVGGEVSIDTSPAETPEATIAKAQQIRRAANAPADPSSQDRTVAAKAAQLEQKARQELQAQQRTGDADNSTGSTGNNPARAEATRTALAAIYNSGAVENATQDPGRFINVAV